MPDVSVVIPVYNSEKNLNALFDRLVATLDSLAEIEAYEIIFVEDSSRDRSWEVIQGIASRDPRVTGIRHSRNFGQHNALLRGIRAAKYELILTCDDDLQHPPEEIPILYDQLVKGFDVVYGTPKVEKHSLARVLSSKITKWILSGSMGADTAQKVSSFRLFRTYLREAFHHYDGSFISIDVLLTWGTSSFTAVAVEHDARNAGASNYTFRKLMTHAFNMITGFSIRPLQLASFIGFFFTFFGICVFGLVVGRYLIQGGSVPGFPFLASVIAIFSGAQLFTIGIIGEYLARIHFRTMGRPYSIVKECVGNIQDEESHTSVPGHSKGL